jgi:hypothetical protein
VHLGADADNSALVKVAQRVLADIRYIAGYLLGAELGLACLELVFLDVDRV